MRGAGRQQGRPRATFLGVLLAWSGEGTRACGVPGANRAGRRPLFLLFPVRGSRSKAEFIGFAGRQARTETEPGPPFLLFPFRGSRSETEFIGFAGRQARTKPEFGPLFHLFPFRGSRSETEFIGFAGSRPRTETEPGPPFHLFPARRSVGDPPRAVRKQRRCWRGPTVGQGPAGN